jgi:hypothetical protein
LTRATTGSSAAAAGERARQAKAAAMSSETDRVFTRMILFFGSPQRF